MFRRKSKNEAEDNICPYCEFVNAVNVNICSQCYYQLEKSARDQGEPISTEVSSDIFNELMSEEDDSWEEGKVLEVVLAVDEDALEVEQYEATDFDSEESETFGFLPSKSPELTQTKVHKASDITEEDLGESTVKDVPRLEFSNNPLSEVTEPVHIGKGSVYSPSSPKMDDDLLGHIGGEELAALPLDDFYESKVNLTSIEAPPPPPPVPEIVVEPVVEKAPPPTPEMVLPELPNLDESPEVDSIELPDVPEIDSEPVPAPALESAPVPVPTPPLVNDGRFWPWPASEAWDPRQIHREVVFALELSKAGKKNEAEATIDALGPHLTDNNVDLLYHIGMVLKQIGRDENVSWMLTRAHEAMPDNEHVSSAITHLKNKEDSSEYT